MKSRRKEKENHNESEYGRSGELRLLHCPSMMYRSRMDKFFILESLLIAPTLCPALTVTMALRIGSRGRGN